MKDQVNGPKLIKCETNLATAHLRCGLDESESHTVTSQRFDPGLYKEAEEWLEQTFILL